jgi:hypothetical protein
VGQVQRPAGEPGGEFAPGGAVEHPVVRLEELDAQVAQDGIPEPLGVAHRPAVRLGDVRQAVLTEEGGQA